MAKKQTNFSSIKSNVSSYTGFKKLSKDLRNTLIEAIELGNLSVMPPRNDGTKRPYITEWKTFQEEMATEEQLVKWYLKGLTGFGLICGEISANLECLDFDTRKAYKRFRLRMKKLGLLPLLKLLEKGYMEQTPNGYHLLYRCSEISGSTKLATKPDGVDEKGNNKTKTLIETKGEGGFIICAPSHGGVNRDGEYKVVKGSLSSIPTITPAEREGLHNVARTFHIKDKKDMKVAAEKVHSDSLRKAGRPGSDFNARAEWSDILEGWLVVYERSGVQYVRRPGKDTGVSGTINYQGKDLFHNYSTSTPFEQKDYDKFGAYAVLRHNGDFSGAAKQLIQDGYGGAENTTKPEYSEAEKELALSCFPEIPFPLEVFPEEFRNLVHTFAKALQCPPAFMAMCFLTVVSGAAGNAVTLNIKSSWRTSPFLWLGVIGKSGDGKTPPINASMQPIWDLQDTEKVRHEAEEAAAKDKDKEKPVAAKEKRHYYSSNFTIESLIPMFKASARGLIIHVDELAGLIKSFNQYKSKGADKEQFISLYNAGPLKSDRKGGSDSCPESGAAVIGGIQPSIYKQVFGDTEHENGLAYRFLPFLLNAKPAMFSDDDLSSDDLKKWSDLVKWMYDIPAPVDPATGRIIRQELTVDTEIRAIWVKFQNDLSAWGPFMPPQFSRYLPKLKDYSLKFMSLIHLLKCCYSGELTLSVDRATVEGGIQLTRYFAGQALKLCLGTSGDNMQVQNTTIYDAAFQQALDAVKPKFKKGKLLLKCFRDKVNEILPSELTLDDNSKKPGAWLREHGFKVEPGTGGKSYIIWNEDELG